MYGVSNFFWSYSAPGPVPMQSPPCGRMIRPTSRRWALTWRSLPS